MPQSTTINSGRRPGLHAKLWLTAYWRRLYARASGAGGGLRVAKPGPRVCLTWGQKEVGQISPLGNSLKLYSSDADINVIKQCLPKKNNPRGIRHDAFHCFILWNKWKQCKPFGMTLISIYLLRCLWELWLFWLPVPSSTVTYIRYKLRFKANLEVVE